ncbi:hypothetical protein B0H21DRAFT_706089 [Amylocystis lapponica]|nr:hypothetical protein B0H21DRAFT_706089 [Amylocystis lapponica]
MPQRRVKPCNLPGTDGGSEGPQPGDLKKHLSGCEATAMNTGLNKWLTQASVGQGLKREKSKIWRSIGPISHTKVTHPNCNVHSLLTVGGDSCTLRDHTMSATHSRIHQIVVLRSPIPSLAIYLASIQRQICSHTLKTLCIQSGQSQHRERSPSLVLCCHHQCSSTSNPAFRWCGPGDALFVKRAAQTAYICVSPLHVDEGSTSTDNIIDFGPAPHFHVLDSPHSSQCDMLLTGSSEHMPTLALMFSAPLYRGSPRNLSSHVPHPSDVPPLPSIPIINRFVLSPAVPSRTTSFSAIGTSNHGLGHLCAGENIGAEHSSILLARVYLTRNWPSPHGTGSIVLARYASNPVVHYGCIQGVEAIAVAVTQTGFATLNSRSRPVASPVLVEIANALSAEGVLLQSPTGGGSVLPKMTSKKQYSSSFSHQCAATSEAGTEVQGVRVGATGLLHCLSAGGDLERRWQGLALVLEGTSVGSSSGAGAYLRPLIRAPLFSAAETHRTHISNLRSPLSVILRLAVRTRVRRGTVRRHYSHHSAARAPRLSSMAPSTLFAFARLPLQVPATVHRILRPFAAGSLQTGMPNARSHFAFSRRMLRRAPRLRSPPMPRCQAPLPFAHDT